MKSLEDIKQKYETFADNHPRAIKYGKAALFATAEFGLDTVGAKYGLSGKATAGNTLASIKSNLLTSPESRDLKAVALGHAANHALTFAQSTLDKQKSSL